MGFNEERKKMTSLNIGLIMGIVFIILKSYYELIFALRLTNALFGFIAIIVGIYLSFVAVSQTPSRIPMTDF